MRYRELECESCGAGLKLALPSARAWHSTCPRKAPQAAFPRYVPVKRGAAQPSET